MDYSDFSNKDEKEEKDDENSVKRNIDKNNYGFDKIKTFTQLKNKVLEIKREQEKTKIDVGENTNKIEYIENRLDQIKDAPMGEEPVKNATTSEGNKSHLDNQISDINKKLKFLLGDINMEDIDNNDNDNDSQNKDNKKKFMNFEELNRRLTKLQFTKVDNTELDAKNEKLVNKIDDVERKMNELIYGLYGEYINNKEKNNGHQSKKSMAFLKLDDFEVYKVNIEKELDKIRSDIEKLKKVIEVIFDHLKDKASIKDTNDIKSYLMQKVEEIINNLSKKFVEKNENANAFKNLEDQFKKVLILLATKAEHENDNWLIAKKPMNGFSCAACESFIGELKEEPVNKYIPWNKMPLREREKELEKEKMYRLGDGYSRVLKMVGFDNNGNVTLNATSSVDINSLFAGNNNNENSKIKEGYDLQVLKPSLHERVQSAHSKNSKEKDKIIDVIKTKNLYDKKLPKIKGSMSSDNFDKIIENPNPNLNNAVNSNSNNNSTINFMNPKITKIMKKTQNRFNV
jgi:hypothetical protein